MGNIFSGDKLYFDELAAGISTGLNHDNGFYWDTDGSLVLMTLDVTLGTDKYYANEVLDVDMVLDVTEDENYSKFVDLMELVPYKFRDSTSLREFFDETGIEVGTWIGYINDLQEMLDKYNVSEDYIQYLADLVGLRLMNTQTTSVILDKRRQLVQVIDWYKMKGTYAAMLYIGYILNLSLALWDRYTSNYSTFYPEAWFTGKENQMPLDLPHIDENYTKLLLHCDGIEGSTTFVDSSGDRGTWNSGVTYNLDDLITYGGTTWQSLQNSNIGNTPTAGAWWSAYVTHTITSFGGAYITTGEQKFGTGSCRLDGVVSYLSVDSNSDFDFGVSDFTVDLQVKFASLTNEQDLISKKEDINNYFRFYKESNGAGNKLHMVFMHEVVIMADYVMTNDWTDADLAWHHFAFVRDGSTGRILIDGVAQVLTEVVPFGTKDMGDITATEILIGQYNSTNFVNGWIDEVNIMKGYARFTTDFTPFTFAYQHFYKSPYIGLEVILNQVYGVSPNKHLIETSKYDDLALYVELVRPVNVVPAYWALLLPETDETGAVTTVDGEIKTCVLGSWTFTKDYFDQGYVTSGTGINFDNGEHFDNSRDVFLNSIVKWKLGTGNKEVTPGPGFIIENELLSGSIDEIRIYSDRTEYEFEVASGTARIGMSELALYLADDTIEVACTFPDIDLSAAVSLRVIVTINR
jgi:hypothetical protein